jgi:hypothetical protein
MTGQFIMQIPTGELAAILSDIETVLAACKQSDPVPAAQSTYDTDLPALAQALDQLVDVMTRIESDRQASSDTTSADITEIGEYALQLHEALSAAARTLDVSGQQQPLAYLAINIALWIARHRGQIETLEPVADAIALVANSSREPAELGKLTAIISEIIPAVSSLISQDLEKMNPGRPWRVLLLNYCIVATRSHDTGLMEDAFAVLTGKLPEDATRFFSEGMGQMEALDYPPQVRKVMQKYHSQWPVKRSLH